MSPAGLLVVVPSPAGLRDVDGWVVGAAVAADAAGVLVVRAVPVASTAVEVAAVRRGIAFVNSWPSARRAPIAARFATSCSMP